MDDQSAGSAVDSWSVFGLAAAVRSGRLPAAKLMEICRRRVEAGNDRLKAFVHLDWSSAERAAEQADADIRRGVDVGPLAGVPFGVKDTEDCAGMPTRFGSLLRQSAPVAATDAPHVARLRAAGAIPVGKTAAPEFMSGLLTESPASGVTRNPWNEAMTPGGSSGGSAAAVASGMVPFATGSDGGGSLRIPAAFCGLVGLKTTFGVVPDPCREPSMTSCLGVLTWEVADTARLIDIMGGPHDADIVSSAVAAQDLASALERTRLEGVRVAYLPTLCGAGAAPDVASACEKAVSRLVAAGLTELATGYELEEDCNELFVGVCAADSWKLIEVHGVDPSSALLSSYFRARLQNASAVTIAELVHYQRRREQLAATFASWFQTLDVILAPTLSTCEVTAAGPPPTRIAGQRYEGPGAAAPITRLANLAGLPSVSVPVGIASNGVPIGMQVTTARHRDALALRVGMELMKHSFTPGSRPTISV